MEDSNTDIETWANKIPRWLIAQSGAAVLILDHVSKDPETRGRYARGAGHKLNVLDGMQFQMRVTKAFSKTQAGAAVLGCGKDRGGNFATGEKVASVSFEPSGAGSVLRIEVKPHTDDMSPRDEWQPTVIMGMIAKHLAESHIPLTASAVKTLFPNTNSKLVSSALTRLMEGGYVAESRGGRSLTKTLRLLRPYGDSGAQPAEPQMFPDEVVEPDWLKAEHTASVTNLDDYR